MDLEELLILLIAIWPLDFTLFTFPNKKINK